MKKRIRPTHDRKRALLVQNLAIKWDCTTVNVHKAINGHSVTEQSLLIKKEYQKKYAELSQVLS